MTGTLNNCERCEHRAHRGDSGGWCDMFQLEPRELCGSRVFTDAKDGWDDE